MGIKAEADRFFWYMVIGKILNCRDHFSEISYISLLYLDIVRYNPGCTVGKIAEILDLDKSTVSRKVDSLVAEGLLSKEKDPRDGRLLRLSPGPEWSDMYDKVDAPYDRALRRIQAEMSPEEVETCCRALRIVSEELGKSEQIASLSKRQNV